VPAGGGFGVSVLAAVVVGASVVASALLDEVTVPTAEEDDLADGVAALPAHALASPTHAAKTAMPGQVTSGRLFAPVIVLAREEEVDDRGRGRC
jgi:hypothetical protein